MSIAYFVVLAYAALALLLGWIYFRRWQVTRPPIGVLSLGDITLALAAIVVVPLLYLALPLWLVAGLLVVGMGTILYVAWEPVCHRRWAVWLVTSLCLAADLWAVHRLGTASNGFFVVNNLVLVLGIVGATNLWAQSGLQARHAALLGGGLMVYDFVATSRLPLMHDLVTRLAGLPFAPLVAWHTGAGQHGLGVGLGDLLLATVFPLVMRKAYGRAAGAAGPGPRTRKRAGDGRAGAADDRAISLLAALWPGTYDLALSPGRTFACAIEGSRAATPRPPCPGVVVAANSPSMNLHNVHSSAPRQPLG